MNDMNQFKIAVIGAHTPSGSEFMDILQGESFSPQNIIPLYTDSIAGQEISFGENGNHVFAIQKIEDFDFSSVQFAIFLTDDPSISSIYSPKALDSGCSVIDNNYHYYSPRNVPIIIPELSQKLVTNRDAPILIANPSPISTQIAISLSYLHDIYKIKRIILSSYNSVSDMGYNAMNELFNETKDKMEISTPAAKHTDTSKGKIPLHNYDPNDEDDERIEKVLPETIAFNCIPCVGDVTDNKYTTEENRIVHELRCIFDNENMPISATCVYTPVFIGHAVSINVEFEQTPDMSNIDEILEFSPSVAVCDDKQDGKCFTHDISRDITESIIISRLRQEFSNKNALNLWTISNNLRHSSALNAFQILNSLIEMKKSIMTNA